MNHTDTTFKYDLLTKVFHWISAIIILWALFSGFIVFQTVKDQAILDFVSSFNVSITLLLVPIFIARIINRIHRSRYETDNSKNAAATFVHICIYLTTIFILITGVFMIKGDVNFFGTTLFTNSFDESLANASTSAHIYSCMVLGGLVFLHVMAVVKHHFMGNRIMLKMV